MRRPTWIHWTSILCLVALTIGCGEGKPKLNPVTGIVTYRNQPVEGATVSFRCEEAKTMATATTDAQGKFKLTTYQAGEGAVAGKHKVTVTKIPAPVAASGTGTSMEDVMKAGKGGPAPQPKNELPAKYADPAQSGLDQTVVAGPNDFKLDLKD